MKESPTLHASGPVPPCHVCTAPALQLIPGYENFRRVTSDCKPWPHGGRLYVCGSCGAVQKMIDDGWQGEVQQIYQAYSIYHQSQGAEQAVYDANSGGMAARSARLLERLFSQIALPETGRLLDVGCGNGGLLRSFHRLAPGWSLTGSELSDKYQAIIQGIPGVDAFYTCAPHRVPGIFHLITMVHLLEHIPHPADFLSGIRDKLELDGFLLVEVPNFLQNPFDLLISDHCSHFTSQLLTNLLTATGYEVITAADDWVPKELTMVARKASRPQGAKDAVSPSDSWQAAIDGLQWLESIKAMAQRLARGSNFGLFGTSIAATWLSTELGDAVSFYVDEDPQRAGKTYLGRPIYFPQGIPSGSHVFIALAYKVAASIYRRLAVRYPEVKFYLPTP